MAQYSPTQRLVTEARLPALADELGIGGVGVPIFETRAEGEAWGAQNPGKTWYTAEAVGPRSVTPAAPTSDDATDTYTIPESTGYEYRVGGVTKAPGTYSVGNTSTSVIVTAVSTDEMVTLTGTTSWTLAFTKATTYTVMASDTFSEADGTAVIGSALDAPASTMWVQAVAANVAATTTAGKATSAASGANNQYAHTVELSTPVTVPTIAACRVSLDYDGTGTNASFGAEFRPTLTYTSTRYRANQIATFILGRGTTATAWSLTSGATGLDNTDIALTLKPGLTIPDAGTLSIEVIDKAGSVKINGTEYATFVLPGTLSTSQKGRWQIGRPKAVMDNYKMEIMQ